MPHKTSVKNSKASAHKPWRGHTVWIQKRPRLKLTAKAVCLACVDKGHSRQPPEGVCAARLLIIAEKFTGIHYYCFFPVLQLLI